MEYKYISGKVYEDIIVYAFIWDFNNWIDLADQTFLVNFQWDFIIRNILCSMRILVYLVNNII